MSKKSSSGSGLMSSAGLMRYYEADKKAVQIDPKTVLAFGVAIGFAVLMLNGLYGLWP
ncbi:MAG: preprotein translocase subunit Sec61beta [Methanomethylovorans sp.]|uniref:preprotein translocase subunit Sec61beta n=1 Tax=Methanomethylovorans sp. TaxID=2758717 RepID=UPI001BD6266A|nr:preprotein translocase subunit Sec61beta [Methanomethylovorans sp.]